MQIFIGNTASHCLVRELAGPEASIFFLRLVRWESTSLYCLVQSLAVNGDVDVYCACFTHACIHAHMQKPIFQGRKRGHSVATFDKDFEHRNIRVMDFLSPAGYALPA